MAAFIKLGDIKGEFSPSREAHANRFTTGGGGDSLNDAGLGNNNAYVDEDVDGFMKLGDIKGEFAGAYSNSLGGFKADALTNGGQKVGLDVGPVNQGANVWTTGPVTGFKADGMVSETWLTDGPLEGSRSGSVTQEVGWWTVDGADFRNGSKTHEGVVIPTDGDDIVRGEFASKANAYVDGAIGGFQSDALTSGGQEGFTWEAASDIWTNGGASTFNADALVQQVNGTIGYEMQPDEYFSHNPEWFAPGSAVDSWIEKTFGTGDGEHTFGGISQGNAFAPVNELRSDNRF